MRFFRRLSIQHKLAIIIMATSTLVLLISSGVFIASEITSSRRNAVRQMTSLAGIIAASGRLPLRFNDLRTIEEVLTPLASEPGIVLGLIYNRSDRTTARYLRPGEDLAALGATSVEIGEKMPQILASGEAYHAFHHGYLDVVMPVIDRGEKIGTVYLRSDLGLLRQQIIKLVTGSLAVLGASFLLASLLSFRLQRFVSHPLLQLVQLMATVSRDKDFTVRGQKASDDEIGTLIDGFNGMLAQIESRDRELESHRQSLELQVAQRTQELNAVNHQLHQTVVQLAEARDAAEQASQAKSLFLANMSHEIRTPMIGVLGMTELMMKTGLNGQQKAMAETIYRSGESLLTILNDILDFSKIEAGHLELEEVAFDLLEVVEEAVVLLAEKAYAKGVEVILDLPADLPRQLVGDPGRLRQIVLNLVNNAIKFTDEGEVVVRLRCLKETRREAALQMEVEDTGIGIDPEVQQRIFDSFSQADNSTSRRFGGTGLGLAIVRELVHLMGGEMAVRSQPEKGSTFCLTCRLPKQKKGAAPPQLPPELAGASAVLLIANASARGVLRRHLAALGICAQEAASAQQAHSLLAEATGDHLTLVFFDAAAREGHPPTQGWTEAAGQCRPVFLVSPAEAAAPESACGVPAAIVAKPLRPSRLPHLLTDLIEPEAPRPMAKSMPPPPRTGIPILLVEDNLSTSRLVRAVLENYGYSVETAGNGIEALDRVAGQRFELILMDCRMPAMDGFEATRRMRQRGIGTPVIALTTNSRQEEMQACRVAGMDDFLQKPFKHSQLLELLARWLPTAEAVAAPTARVRQ